MLTKDPNFGFFSDTSGRVTKTYQIDWSRIYSIFYNDNLLDIQNNQLAYQKIRDSGLHAIATRPSILPYTDPVKWIVDNENPKDRSFNGNTGSQLATFHPEVFIKAYGLKPAIQPLNAEFFQASKTKFNFDEMVKYWMNEPSKFSQRKDYLYPITWFREPYSLLAYMLCRLYGLRNCSIFKAERVPISHRILTTSEYFPWT